MHFTYLKLINVVIVKWERGLKNETHFSCYGEYSQNFCRNENALSAYNIYSMFLFVRRYQSATACNSKSINRKIQNITLSRYIVTEQTEIDDDRIEESVSWVDCLHTE